MAHERAHDFPLSSGQVGMLCFLATEVAFFSTLIVSYVIYVGKSTVGPMPSEALGLELPIAGTFCLLLSSVTVHQATAALHGGHVNRFRLTWLATIVLGGLFLTVTAYEWHELIYQHDLTMGRNLFGTTYFTLVGFHAFHVTVGVVIMATVFAIAARAATRVAHGAELVSWYWHFVDGVWIVVFSVVYLYSR
jgi:cytochrome c oxidase subunit 3/cytochrome o ubiquinol oxidase subunit 3